MAEYTITKQNFEKEVLLSDKPVLLDFWASWCGPCAMLSPIIAEIAVEYDGKVKVGKVNVDEEEELASQFRVDGIPFLALIKNGKVVKTSIGYQSKESVKALLEG